MNGCLVKVHLFTYGILLFWL